MTAHFAIAEEERTEGCTNSTGVRTMSSSSTYGTSEVPTNLKIFLPSLTPLSPLLQLSRSG